MKKKDNVNWVAWLTAGMLVEEITTGMMDVLTVENINFTRLGASIALLGYAAISEDVVTDLNVFFKGELSRDRPFGALGNSTMMIALNELGLLKDCLKNIGMPEEEVEKAVTAAAGKYVDLNLLSDITKKVMEGNG